MNYIYSKIKDSLIDFAKIDTIVLNICEVADKPLEGLKIGDWYLTVSFVDSDDKKYCSLADINDKIASIKPSSSADVKDGVLEL